MNATGKVWRPDAYDEANDQQGHAHRVAYGGGLDRLTF